MADDPEATRDLDGAEREALARALKPDLAGVRTRQARAAAKAGLFGAETEVIHVDRYLVLGVLGAGAMGTVFHAYDPKLDRKVALKVLLPDPAPTREATVPEGAHETLVREAQALARVRHPNVVHVYDAGSFEDRVYLTMELIEGQTLRAWLAGEPTRGAEATLRMLIQAGRGLAAVHAAGLVHRDFKPDNVLVGTDGVARVADFGLARADTPAAPAPDALETTRGAEGSHGTTAAGTPAYLAPERLAGIAATARSDQFSFCIAVFEGLAGRRPYSDVAVATGTSSLETRAKLPGDVPPWLDRIVERGLDPDPDARHASMDVLLAEIEAGLAADDRRDRRRIIAKRSGIALSLLGALAAAAHVADRIDRDARVAACEVAAAELDALWPARAQEVSSGIRASELSFAAETVAKLEPLLAAWADEWRATRRQVCMDASVERSLPDALSARANSCLDLRRVEVQGLIDLLASGDSQAIEHAVTSVAGLPPVRACTERRFLEHGSWPSADQWDDVLETRKALAAAAALEWAGKHDEARELVRAALARAEALAWQPLVAGARLQIGSLEGAAGNFEAAHEELEAAFFVAQRAEADEVAAAAATQLTSMVGARLARPEAGLQWAKHAEVLLDRIEAGPRLRASLDRAHGAIYTIGFDLEQAKTRYRMAADRLEEAFGPEHPDVATTLGGLATVHRKQGDYATAESIQARVLELTERGLGPNHPAVSDALNNLAAVHLGAGATERAAPLFERALAIVEAAFGDDHPDLVNTLDNLAKVREAAGELDRARALYERSLRITERRLGPDHPRLGRTLSDLGALVASQGESERARELFERAYAVTEKAYGPDHPDAAAILGNLGVLHQWAGRLEQAFELQHRALLVTEKELGADHLLLSGPLYNLGSLLLDLDRPREAVAYFERCVAIFAAHEGEQEHEGSALYMLARSLLASGGDRTRALALARDAQTRFATKPPPNPADRERLAKLLAEYDR